VYRSMDTVLRDDFKHFRSETTRIAQFASQTERLIEA
jgi:hypothetical protein